MVHLRSGIVDFYYGNMNIQKLSVKCWENYEFLFMISRDRNHGSKLHILTSKLISLFIQIILHSYITRMPSLYYTLLKDSMKSLSTMFLQVQICLITEVIELCVYLNETFDWKLLSIMSELSYRDILCIFYTIIEHNTAFEIDSE